MSLNTPLASSDADLLLQMLCCVIAADKRISGKEIQVVADTFAAHGSTMPTASVKDNVIKHCKEIHAKGVDAYIAELLPRLATQKTSAIAEVFGKVHQALIAADGESSPEEQRVAECLLAAFRKPGSLSTAERPAADATGLPGQAIDGVDPATATGTTAGTTEMEPWKVAAAIVFMPPIGLYLLWSHPKLSSSKMWWRCGIAYIALGMLLTSVAKNREQARAQKAADASDSKWSRDVDRALEKREANRLQEELRRAYKEADKKYGNGLP